MSDTLTRLAKVLEERKGAAADSSYVASLYHKGLNKILEKVGEESVETIIAAKDAAISGDCSDVIYETADLWFHSMVMLAQLGQHPQAVLDELDRRFGLSGHGEQASRRSALTTFGEASPHGHFLLETLDRQSGGRGVGVRHQGTEEPRRRRRRVEQGLSQSHERR